MAAPKVTLTTSGGGFIYAELTGPIATHEDTRNSIGIGVVTDTNAYGIRAATKPGWRLKRLSYVRKWRYDYSDGTSYSDEETFWATPGRYEYETSGNYLRAIEETEYGLSDDDSAALWSTHTVWYENVVIESERDDPVEIVVTRYPETEAAAQTAGGRVAEAGVTSYFKYPREDLTISLQATPLAGYRFVNWYHSAGSIIADSSSASTTATYHVREGMTGTLAIDFTAEFTRLTCRVTTAPTPAGCGTTVPTAGTPYMYSTCTVVATGAVGCSFLRWTVDGITVSRSRSFSFRVERDIHLVAHFHRWTHLILRQVDGKILRQVDGKILRDD